MPKSNFFLNDDDIIEITTTGDRTSMSIQESAERVFALARELRDSGRPVLILNDISQMGTLPPEGHKTFADIAKTADYDRFALVGADNIARLGANLIAQSIGKIDQLKYFDTRDRAAAWLLEFKNNSAG